MDFALVAKRSFIAWGNEYNIGDVVDATKWPADHRAEALANRLRSGDVGVPDTPDLIGALVAPAADQPETAGKKK